MLWKNNKPKKILILSKITNSSVILLYSRHFNAIFNLIWSPLWVSQAEQLVKKPLAIAGGTIDVGLIPGSGKSPGVGNGKQLQYSCLENSIDRGAWQASVRGVAKNHSWACKLTFLGVGRGTVMYAISSRLWPIIICCVTLKILFNLSVPQFLIISRRIRRESTPSQFYDE